MRIKKKSGKVGEKGGWRLYDRIWFIYGFLYFLFLKYFVSFYLSVRRCMAFETRIYSMGWPLSCGIFISYLMTWAVFPWSTWTWTGWLLIITSRVVSACWFCACNINRKEKVCWMSYWLLLSAIGRRRIQTKKKNFKTKKKTNKQTKLN